MNLKNAEMKKKIIMHSNDYVMTCFMGIKTLRFLRPVEDANSLILNIIKII